MAPNSRRKKCTVTSGLYWSYYIGIMEGKPKLLLRIDIGVIGYIGVTDL